MHYIACSELCRIFSVVLYFFFAFDIALIYINKMLICTGLIIRRPKLCYSLSPSQSIAATEDFGIDRPKRLRATDDDSLSDASCENWNGVCLNASR
jgi:hypothetical protein